MWVKLATPSTGMARPISGADSPSAISPPASQIGPACRLRSARAHGFEGIEVGVPGLAFRWLHVLAFQTRHDAADAERSGLFPSPPKRTEQQACS